MLSAQQAGSANSLSSGINLVDSHLILTLLHLNAIIPVLIISMECAMLECAQYSFNPHSTVTSHFIQTYARANRNINCPVQRIKTAAVVSTLPNRSVRTGVSGGDVIDAGMKHDGMCFRAR